MDKEWIRLVSRHHHPNCCAVHSPMGCSVTFVPDFSLASNTKAPSISAHSPDPDAQLGQPHILAEDSYNQPLDLSPGVRRAPTLWRTVVRLLFGGYVIAPGVITTSRRHK